MKRFISCLLLIILYLKGISQVNKDTSGTKFFYNDIYDNFDKQHGTTSQFVIIRSKISGKIIYEGSINSGYCPECYEKLTSIADSTYKEKNYEDAGLLYAAAFNVNMDKGKVKHRYAAACCYAQIKNADAAFQQLDKIVSQGKYYNTIEISKEKCFKELHSDKRWEPLMEGVRKNLKKVQNELDGKTKSEQINPGQPESN